MKFLLISLLWLSSGLLHAVEDFPPPFTAHYKLYYGNIPAGEGTRTLKQQENGQWVVESTAKATGLALLLRNSEVTERSIFNRKDNTVQPIEYIYQQTGKKPRSQHIIFDWVKRTAVNHFEDKTVTFALETATLDKLLYQIVLMQQLKQGQRQFQYQVIDKDKLNIYQPQWLGNEVVKTGLGELDTLKYQRVSTNKGRRTTLWCAPSLHYLPVRVDHQEHEGDSVLSMVLQAVEGLKSN